MDENIKEAINVFRQGGIVIFPTDTAFGIGCLIDRVDVIERLFDIRKRPLSQAMPVLVSGVSMAHEYVSEIPKEVKDKLIIPYWPGALTIVLPAKKEKVNTLVRSGGESVGLRMPNHQLLLEVIETLGIPILGPSANFHGEATPYSLEDLDPALIKLADYVLEGECYLKKPSTIIDCTALHWKILRKGALDIKI